MWRPPPITHDCRHVEPSSRRPLLWEAWSGRIAKLRRWLGFLPLLYCRGFFFRRGSLSFFSKSYKYQLANVAACLYAVLSASLPLVR
ncbi:hypothetical protein COCNU_01G009850 [Cocos nucifera]|uniref:Uncharacterized protein n=1 Tax=Cocos nucifera TaxID=13894 RepID=A0A8K0HUQ6_COCNU|nr:hypothetical protein COCNU_01G009850 [Cocos nucifera]